jgi:threonine/homoserine/homoserine lactone efflux protein
VGGLLAFLAVAALVIVTPGPDTAITIRRTLLGGRRAGVMSAFGVVTGQACWSLAASAGVTALLVASEPAGGASFATMLALGLVFCATTWLWLALYATAVARMGAVLRRPGSAGRWEP